MRPVRVSVVMGVRGGAGLLGESLDSVLNQRGVDFELVLVVDGGLDPEAETALSARLQSASSLIRVLRVAADGLTQALIVGCDAARGDYIARIDAGDRMAPGRLARQASVLDRYPDCVLVACATEVYGPDWEPLWVQHGHPASGVPVTLVGTDPKRGLDGDIPHHGATLFRRATYRACGGYRAAFYYGQDWDLWYRLAEYGTYCLLPEALYQARLLPHALSMRRWQQQRRIAACSLGAFVARRQGLDEAPYLARARAIRPNTQPDWFAWLARLWSGGDGAYFIGEALRRRGHAQARRYLIDSIRSAPLQARAYVRLMQTWLTPQ